MMTAIEAREAFERVLLEYGKASQDFQVRLIEICDLSERLAAVMLAYDNAIKAAQHAHDEMMPDWCITCLKASEYGGERVVDVLKKIAETGEHRGTFGGKSLEAAAQAILKLHKPADLQTIQIRFDGPPGPVAGRFVEVEDDQGCSIGVGEWVQDGEYWLLKIPRCAPRRKR